MTSDEATLITGATGFLGRHLVEQWKHSGGRGRLRVLCRGVSTWDEDPQVEVIRGDINCAADLARALEGAKQIYHLAGAVSRDPDHKWPLYRVHVEGTRNLCETVLQRGAQSVEKIVLVSSSGTIAVSRGPVVHDENSGYKHEVIGEWPYYLSKIFAEKLAFSYVRERRLPLVVVNPGLILGPGDLRGSSTRDVALFLKGQILAVPSGGLNFVDARDAAAGLVAAMRRGRPGERYLLGGPNWTFRELLEKLSQVSGVRAPMIQLPARASLAGARVLRKLYPLFDRTYQLDDASIKMAALFWYCDSTKARDQLGFQTRDPMETLKDTVEDVRKRLKA